MEDLAKQSGREPDLGDVSLVNMKNILAGFLADQFTKGASILVLGTGASQLLGLALLGVVTRLFNPSEMGILAVYAALINILSILAGLRYEMALPLANNDRDAALIYSAAMGFSAALCVLIVAAAFLAGVLPFGSTYIQKLGSYIWLVPVGLFAASQYQAASFYASRDQDYHLISITKVIQAVLQGGVQIGMGLVHAGPLGLIVGQILGVGAGGGRLMKPRWRSLREAWKEISLADFSRILRKYRRFPQYVLPSAVINGFAENIPMLAISMMFGAKDAGLFFLAQRAISSPMMLIAESVRQVYYAEASKEARGEGDLYPLFVRVAKILAWIAASVAFIMYFFVESLIGVFFGEKWVVAGTMIVLLLPLLMARLVISPIAVSVMVVGRQDLTLKIQAALLLISLLSFVTSGYLGFGVMATIFLYSVLMALYYGATFLIVRRTVRSHAAALAV